MATQWGDKCSHFWSWNNWSPTRKKAIECLEREFLEGGLHKWCFKCLTTKNLLSLLLERKGENNFTTPSSHLSWQTQNAFSLSIGTIGRKESYPGPLGIREAHPLTSGVVPVWLLWRHFRQSDVGRESWGGRGARSSLNTRCIGKPENTLFVVLSSGRHR